MIKFSKLIIRIMTMLITAALVVIRTSAQEDSAAESTSTRPKVEGELTDAPIEDDLLHGDGGAGDDGDVQR